MSFTKKQYIITAIILIFALIFGIGVGAISWIIKHTPDISDYKGSTEATLIYSADGQLLTKLFKENRIYVPIERIPEHLKKAIISIEDTSFYGHHGIDFWGIPRAFITNIKEGKIVQGFSTITMQLAENALFKKQERTYYRKIQEIYLALQFERLYTKPEILEMYLNEIFLGHSAYGVQTAAHQYFGKNVWELSLSESALIAGLPKAPNYYTPLRNPEAAKRRRNIVLNRMYDLGYINQNEYEKAKNAEIKLKPDNPDDNKQIAPYFIRYVRNKLIDRFGPQLVYSGGLKVYTTLDVNMQEKAEKNMKKALDSYIPNVERSNLNNLQPQLSIVTINPDTGAVRAMIGGRGNDEFNRATQAVRQPGSAFKPFVYTTAIKNNYSTSSVINDMPMLAASEKGEARSLWPKNFQDKYRGYVNLRTALTHSINVAAVKLLKKVGVSQTISTSEKMGISTFTKEDDNKAHLSLALGGLTQGVKPIEMATAYGIFANEGIKVKPYVINKVLNKNNETLYKNQTKKEIVLSSESSYIMTDMLRSVVEEGTGWRANLDHPIAGKTGTTNNYTDAWFVGFTPDLVTAVWIGEDNPREMVYDQKDKNGNYIYSEGNSPRTISSSEAVMLWSSYMEDVLADRPKKEFPVPNNIYRRKIDPITGLLANKYTPNATEEIFRKNNIPENTDDLHGPVESVEIDIKSGMLATNNCPEEQVEKYNYISGSNIRVGPDTIYFEELQKNKDNTEKNKNNEEEKIEGTYFVNKGEPVQKIDPETGVPIKNKKGQVIYEKKPAQLCPLHNKSEDDKVLDFIRNLWDKNE